MIAVIQCAARKKPEAGYLRKVDGTRVKFVADPAIAPESLDYIYARPDDPSHLGRSWRAELVRYNENPGNNPLGLYPAFDLYQNDAYRQLVDRFGTSRTFIVSAGWGLIGASFLTPQYDITFTQMAKKKAPWKFRSRKDLYDDLCLLPGNTTEPIVFFGGKDYLPLFCRMTEPIVAPKTVFYNSAVAPSFPGITPVPYRATKHMNWHYDCVKDFLSGRISPT